MKKLLLVAPSMLLLMACSAPSVEELVDDPKLLEKVLAECSDMKRSEAVDDQFCVNAGEAVVKSTKKMIGNFMGK